MGEGCTGKYFFISTGTKTTAIKINNHTLNRFSDADLSEFNPYSQQWIQFILLKAVILPQHGHCQYGILDHVKYLLIIIVSEICGERIGGHCSNTIL